MKELVLLKSNKAVTTSIKVAEYFKKDHEEVLNDIKTLECSDKFKKDNFMFSENDIGKYATMTKDGFTFLVMGYKGKRASKFKENYIKAFNYMEMLVKDKQTEKYKKSNQIALKEHKVQMAKLDNGVKNKNPIKYLKANTLSDKAVSMMFGYKKMIKKDEMTSDMLKERIKIMEQVTSLMVAQSLGIDIKSISEVIYKNIKTRV